MSQRANPSHLVFAVVTPSVATRRLALKITHPQIQGVFALMALVTAQSSSTGEAAKRIKEWPWPQLKAALDRATGCYRIARNSSDPVTLPFHIWCVPVCWVGAWPRFEQQYRTAQRSNTAMPTMARQARRSFQTRIAAELDRDLHQYPPPEKGRDYKNELFISYDPPFLTWQFTSITFYLEDYSGGAHPNTFVHNENYNSLTGKRLRLADICRTDKAKLKEMVVAKLLKQLEYPQEDWIRMGVDDSGLENFSFNSKTITFYFHPYQVAAYVEGVQKVALERNELKGK